MKEIVKGIRTCRRTRENEAMQMTRLGGLEKPAETQMQRMNKLTMVYNSKVLLSNKKE